MAPRLALATCAEVPELDPEGKLLLAACREAGIETEAAIWDDDGIDWDGFDLVLLRSTWDYKDKPAEFRAWTERIGTRLRNSPRTTGSRSTWSRFDRVLIRSTWDYQYQGRALREWAASLGHRLINPLAAIEWNLSKHYLRTLEAGASRSCRRASWRRARSSRAADRRRVRGQAGGLGRLQRHGPLRQPTTASAPSAIAGLLGAGRTVMFQPFLTSVETEAETR